MKKLLIQKYFNGGISESEKEGARGSFYFSNNLDIYSDSSKLSLNSLTTKNSGTTVVDLVKWIKAGTPYSTNTYFYGNAGHVYVRASNGTWTDLQTTSNSYGQGFEIYNDYLYYTQNTQIGRYGTLSGTPAFDDDWQTGLNDTSTTKFAPIKAFQAGFAVGHGNYLGWWDGSVWDTDRIVLPPGFNIRTLDVLDEYLVIGAWRGTAITDTEDGYLVFWDGTSTYANFFIRVPDGAVSAMINSRNRLLSTYGSSGNLYLGYNPFQKVAQIPKLTNTKYIDVYPGAITNWKGLTLIGVAGATDSASIYQGIYQYGTKNDKYGEALNFGYTISSGNTSATNISIGSVQGFGDELYIGWKDNTTYGVDRIIQTASPFATGTWESLIFDDGSVGRDKLALVIKVNHLPLVSGESIQLGYKTNRASSYTTDTANSTVGSTETRLPIKASAARFREFQFEVVLATSGSTSPTVTEVSLLYDNLLEEAKY